MKEPIAEHAEPGPWKPARLVVAAGAASLLLGAVGAFAGHWAWEAYQARAAEQARRDAVAAAEAELKTPKGRQRQAVLDRLNDPDSAQFRNERQSKGDKSVWCGEVNGRNRMGGMVGFRRYVVEMEGAADAPGAGDMVRIDPDNGPRDAEQAWFEQRYMTFCY